MSNALVLAACAGRRERRSLVGPATGGGPPAGGWWSGELRARGGPRSTVARRTGPDRSTSFADDRSLSLRGPCRRRERRRASRHPTRPDAPAARRFGSLARGHAGQGVDSPGSGPRTEARRWATDRRGRRDPRIGVGRALCGHRRRSRQLSGSRTCGTTPGRWRGDDLLGSKPVVDASGDRGRQPLLTPARARRRPPRTAPPRHRERVHQRMAGGRPHDGGWRVRLCGRARRGPAHRRPDPGPCLSAADGYGAGRGPGRRRRAVWRWGTRGQDHHGRRPSCRRRTPVSLLGA